MVMKALKRGDRVGIIAPSSFVDECDIALALIYLEEELGFQIELGTHLYDKYRYMGGTPKQRAMDIMHFYRDPKIKAIICARGGAGSQYILPHLDFEVIKKNKKPIIGFSDSTALQVGIYTKTKCPYYTGFAPKYDFSKKKLDTKVDASFKGALARKPFHVSEFDVVKKGYAEGVLIGGCLTPLMNLAGTGFFPDLKGKILLLEDVWEKTYKIDLMLQQLQQQKGFADLKGVIFGEFVECIVKDPEDGTIDDVIKVFAANVHFPVIKNFPYSHARSRLVLPMGRKIILDANKKRVEF
jgi:muramoyltetrapeptide carboxypeptidase